MKIDRFKSQIDNLQRANRFNVAFFGTGGKNSGLAIRGIRCESASLPGRGFFQLRTLNMALKELYHINHNMTNSIVLSI